MTRKVSWVLFAIIVFILPDLIFSPQLNQDGVISGIAYAESGHLIERKRIKVISVSGAMGYMQIMPVTKIHMKCKNLFDKKENLRCAKKYLRWLRISFCKTGLFCLVMSYRHGYAGYRKRLKKDKLDMKYWVKFLKKWRKHEKI